MRGLCAITFFSIVNADNTINLANKAIEWVKNEENGYFSDKLEFRRENPDDITSEFGIFAKDDIKYKERLMTIPPQCFITAGEEVEEPRALECDTVHNLIDELQKGNSSFYAPYLNFIREDSPRKLPSGWSFPGKKLLVRLLGIRRPGEKSRNHLPPQEPIDWIQNDWIRGCDGDDEDPLEEDAVLWLVERGWSDILVPILDMMNHRNGRYLNTETNSVAFGKTLKVRASRDITKGEQIYTSHNFCTDCGDRAFEYGAFEILRDSGMVEKFPQRWIFGRKFGFELDEVLNSNGKPTGELKLEWISRVPGDESIHFLKFHLERIKAIGQDELVLISGNIPRSEFDLFVEFHEALVTALTYALKTLTECEDPSKPCALSLLEYDKLDAREDSLDYAFNACDVRKFYSMETGWHGYTQLEEFKSHYQSAEFVMDPKNHDVCFELDGTLQIASSYRPHYHEPFVHYTARYLKSVKRVVFVGGGDSMLLHEVLKYPDIELIVGLEIDQKVTRYSFKHFGTQPHWDNDKVEWWFGDACKSLLMLPKEYFGSFDMVLVDLSETVTALSVTDHLDIFDALALLLTEDGIFVKNEYYIEKMSQIFDHALQINYYHVPAICSQTISMGSNKADFLFDELVDHDIQNLYLKSLSDTEDRYELVHDYKKNIGINRHCRDSSSFEFEEEINEQTKSPGIIMILEAEQINVKLEITAIRKLLINAFMKQGLTVDSIILPDSEKTDFFSLIFVLGEGYVTARAWTEFKYCAFDIHLWSSFDKLKAIEETILTSMEADSSSSYRIVAGGMFGVSNWKDDEKKRGPVYTRTCDNNNIKENKTPSPTKEGENLEATIDVITKESMSLLPEGKIVAIVLCGEEKRNCKSLNILKEHERIEDVIPVYPCDNIQNVNYSNNQCIIDEESTCENGDVTDNQSLYSCEQYQLKYMKSATQDKRASLVILDPSSPKAMAKIMHRLFKNRSNKHRILAEDLLMISVATSSSSDENNTVDNTWRKNWIERFRHDIILQDPVSRAQVFFNDTSTSTELNLILCGDNDFNKHFIEKVKTIESATRTKADVRDIKGGLWIFWKDFEPDHFFLPTDYDQTAGLEQWKSQEPKGFQTVLQIEVSTEISNAIVFGAFQYTLNTLAYSSTKIHELNDIGDGSYLGTLLPEASISVLWDGRVHIDINIFMYSANEKFGEEFAKLFMAQLDESTDSSVMLRDEQPRGYGRVVNRYTDVNPRQHPHWAVGLK